MDIDIAVPAGLNLLHGHKKFLVEFLVELIKDQAPLGGNQGAVRVGVLLVPHVHDGLALFVHVVHHAHKILFIVAVIPVTLSHNGLDALQSALHNIVHDGDGNLILLHLVYLVHHKLTDMLLLLIGKFGKSPVGALPYRIDHLLHVKSLQASVFLDDLDLSLGLKQSAVSGRSIFLLVFHVTSSNLSIPVLTLQKTKSGMRKHSCNYI